MFESREAAGIKITKDNTTACGFMISDSCVRYYYACNTEETFLQEFHENLEEMFRRYYYVYSAAFIRF